MSASADMCALKFDSSFVRKGKCGNRMPLRPSALSSLGGPPLRGRQVLFKEGVLFLSQRALCAPPDSNKASEEALLSPYWKLFRLYYRSCRTVRWNRSSSPLVIQERIQERIAEQVVDIPLPQIMEEILFFFHARGRIVP